MLRPEQMSRVSITGSERVLHDVIEIVYDLRLMDLTDYDGSWEGFDPGNPVEKADDISEKLVTIRAIKSTLDIDEDEVDVKRIVTDEAVETELEDIRVRVNELDDRRSELEDDLHTVEEKIDSAKPLTDLGIDIDLLSGYENLLVAVGKGNENAVRDAVSNSDEIQQFELFVENGVIAVFAYPVEDAEEDVLDETLVGVDFTPIEVPDASGSPEEYVAELQHEYQQYESKLKGVENDLENIKLDSAEFLLAAEEELTIEVQKAEAPLQFATTEHAFVAEGWLPSKQYSQLESSLNQELGESIQIDELERVSYNDRGQVVEHDTVEGGEGTPTAADGGETARTDGGTATKTTSEPPVIQKNPEPVTPFEELVRLVDRPKYSEFDPSIVLFFTFPLFFGFMIGDFGYGVLYTLIGYLIYSKADSRTLKHLGEIGMWAGGFTALFGVLFGEVFGLHILGEVVWPGGHPPIEKGLSPATGDFARVWIVLSLLAGLLHVSLGYIFDFAQKLESHGIKDAYLESGSWVVLMVGVWIWIFSKTMTGAKPDFLFTVFNGDPLALGFAGFSTTVGWAALAVGLGIGFPSRVISEMLHYGSAGIIAGALESLQVLVNVLSYVRIAAVLLAKAGMAFVVNLLVFGAYNHHGEFHFLIDHGPSWVTHHYGHEAAIMFPGLIHSGIAGVIFALLIFLVGHFVVLALGITSAGLQALRLEFVEFLSKYYEGGGKVYKPFGYERRYTSKE
ncbi:V-type ATP synthase subunit I [Haladaptatus sp. DFWS20]|uniref:V-type ATP synthase subunit I n=1 Tax=Haladaptatus sp. DFWS20 TaxID=3403467 RepID=UPI003EB89DCB